MEIKVGQIWKRINPLSDNFPSKGWKVKIISIDGNVVSHVLVEYNGKARYDGLSTAHFLDDFLSLYELEEG